MVLYAAPTCPLGKDAVVICKGAGEIVSVKLTLLLWVGVLESVTSNVRGALATKAVGVPVIAPVASFSVSPAGKIPLISDQV